MRGRHGRMVVGFTTTGAISAITSKVVILRYEIINGGLPFIRYL
jgi:hypothetical protein